MTINERLMRHLHCSVEAAAGWAGHQINHLFLHNEIAPFLQSCRLCASNVHLAPLAAEQSTGLSRDGNNFFGSGQSLMNFTYSSFMTTHVHSGYVGHNVYRICCCSVWASYLSHRSRYRYSTLILSEQLHVKIQAVGKKNSSDSAKVDSMDRKVRYSYLKTWLWDKLEHDICGCSTVTLTGV